MLPVISNWIYENHSCAVVKWKFPSVIIVLYILLLPSSSHINELACMLGYHLEMLSAYTCTHRVPIFENINIKRLRCICIHI